MQGSRSLTLRRSLSTASCSSLAVTSASRMLHRVSMYFVELGPPAWMLAWLIPATRKALAPYQGCMPRSWGLFGKKAKQHACHHLKRCYSPLGSHCAGLEGSQCLLVHNRHLNDRCEQIRKQYHYRVSATLGAVYWLQWWSRLLGQVIRVTES